MTNKLKIFILVALLILTIFSGTSMKGGIKIIKGFFETSGPDWICWCRNEIIYDCFCIINP